MKLWLAVKREEQEIEKQLRNLQNELNSLRAAEKALGRSTGRKLKTANRRALSAAATAKISKAAKKRWAKVRAGAEKTVS